MINTRAGSFSLKEKSQLILARGSEPLLKREGAFVCSTVNSELEFLGVCSMNQTRGRWKDLTKANAAS